MLNYLYFLYILCPISNYFNVSRILFLPVTSVPAKALAYTGGLKRLAAGRQGIVNQSLIHLW